MKGCWRDITGGCGSGFGFGTGWNGYKIARGGLTVPILVLAQRLDPLLFQGGRCNLDGGGVIGDVVGGRR